MTMRIMTLHLTTFQIMTIFTTLNTSYIIIDDITYNITKMFLSTVICKSFKSKISYK